MLWIHDVEFFRHVEAAAVDSTFGQPTDHLAAEPVWSGRGRVMQNEHRQIRLSSGRDRIQSDFFVFLPRGDGLAYGIRRDDIFRWGDVVGRVTTVSMDRYPYYVELEVALESVGAARQPSS